MAWTDAQQSAIDSRGENLLVSAAAGSGKTAVLVQRIIDIVLNEKVDVDCNILCRCPKTTKTCFGYKFYIRPR